MGRRGPQPTGAAASNAERQRRWRERQRAQNPVTGSSVTEKKPAQHLSENSVMADAVTEKLWAAFKVRDWSLVVKVLVDLGYQPPQPDPANLAVRCVYRWFDTSGRVTFSVQASEHALALVAWALTDPRVEQVVCDSPHQSTSTYEIVTTDPLYILTALHPPLPVSEDGEVSAPDELKYQILPLMLPHQVTIGKDRAERQHRRWVRRNTKGKWAKLTEPDTEYYCFERSEDAALAKMFIS